MSLIEGIGDEVTVLVTCLLVLAIIIIAWTSTRVDVRMHTSVVIIDRERFGELIRRVRGIAVRSHFAGETDTVASPHSSTAAAATDSLLVSGSAASVQVTNVNPHSLPDDDTDNNQSSGAEHKCLHESEASSSCDDTGSSLQCESASSIKASKDCTESASSHRGSVEASVAADNQNVSQHSPMVCADMPPGSIQVRLQFVDGRQRTVFANPDDTIGHFKRSHFASELASNLVVRFIAGGRELKDETSTLRSHRIAFSGAVLHCLVTPARVTTPPADDRQNVGFHFDIGILMFPLFGTLLAALWYARVVYRGYFNGTSTFSLLAISFLYIVALLASLRGGGPTTATHHPHIE